MPYFSKAEVSPAWLPRFSLPAGLKDWTGEITTNETLTDSAFGQKKRTRRTLCGFLIEMLDKILYAEEILGCSNWLIMSENSQS